MRYSTYTHVLNVWSPLGAPYGKKVLEILGGVTLTEGNSLMELPRSHTTGNDHRSVSKEADLWRETPP